MGEDLLTSGQVADRLGVHQSTVWRIPRDRLRYRKTPGGQRRYRPEDVDAYLAALEADDPAQGSSDA